MVHTPLNHQKNCFAFVTIINNSTSFLDVACPPTLLAITNINVSLDLYIAHSYANLHLYIIFIKKVSFFLWG
jgi:hypothetical protein